MILTIKQKKEFSFTKKNRKNISAYLRLKISYHIYDIFINEH